MGCATGLVKTIVFIFNFLFVLAGLALLAIGVIIHVSYDVKDIDQAFHVAPIVVMVVGSIIFFIAFLGCCGTIKQDTCLLSSYAGILIVLLILQVALIAFVFINVSNGKDLEAFVTKEMKKVFAKYGVEGSSTAFIDATQESLSCCGVVGPSDYLPKVNLPKSCCGNQEGICTIANGAPTLGCGEALSNVIMYSSRWIGYTIIAISGIELIGSVLVCCLISSINNERRRSPYA